MKTTNVIKRGNIVEVLSASKKILATGTIIHVEKFGKYAGDFVLDGNRVFPRDARVRLAGQDKETFIYKPTAQSMELDAMQNIGSQDIGTPAFNKAWGIDKGLDTLSYQVLAKMLKNQTGKSFIGMKKPDIIRELHTIKQK